MLRSYTPIALAGLTGAAGAAGAVWFASGSGLGAALGALAACVGTIAAGAPMLRQHNESLDKLARAVLDIADASDPTQVAIPTTGAPQKLESAIRDALESMSEAVISATAQVRQLELCRKIAETEVEHAAEVFNSLQDAVLVIDSFKELKMANAPAAQMMGLDVASAVSRPVDDVVSDERIRKLIDDTLASASAAHRRHVEHEIARAGGGDPRICDVTLACLPDRKREGVGGVVTIIRDITREREISQMKSDFVSKASHELRTPLASIKAYIEMLLDGEATDEDSRQEFYSVIKSESDRLGRLIDNMLNLSRIEAGIVRPSYEEVDFTEVAQSAVDIIQPQAALKDIGITFQHGPLACTAMADTDMVKQVYLNLLSNAVKYTPEGGRVTLTIENDDATGSVLSTIADTGLGISPDDLDKVFDKFYRIDNYKRVAKGTGLGLPLVKQIVETVHHGDVSVTSTLGLGSKFIFTIPYEAEGV